MSPRGTATALRGRVSEQRRLEDRLASFVFGPAARPGRAAGAPAGLQGDAVAWRYYLARMLRRAGDPAALELLARLRASPVDLDELRGAGAWGADPAALADWIGELATAGLVSREIESGHVELAPLGAALLGLVEEIERRAAGPGPGGGADGGLP